MFPFMFAFLIQREGVLNQRIEHVGRKWKEGARKMSTLWGLILIRFFQVIRSFHEDPHDCGFFVGKLPETI